jgi:hypothetical protein
MYKLLFILGEQKQLKHHAFDRLDTELYKSKESESK